VVRSRLINRVGAFATTDISFADPRDASSGLSNKERTENLETVVEEPDPCYDSDVLDSMSVAGLIALGRNVRLTLKGREMSDVERHRLIKGGAISESTAGLLALLLR
jgi:hypothetical protein